MCLSRKARRCAGAGGLQEAGRLCTETEIRLAQVQLSCIVVAPIPVSILFSLRSIWSICYRRGDGQLSCDLLEWCLGVGQSELMAKEGGFRRVTVRCRNIQGLCRVNEGLCLLHKAAEVEHCSCFCGEPRRCQWRMVFSFTSCILNIPPT